MKNKIFTLFFALVASIGTMSAESGTCGENVTWGLTEGVLTISGTGAMENYGYNGAPWNSSRKSITSAIISDGVTNIGSNAFYDCTSLTSVIIGNNVIRIGIGAFEECRNLVSINIPNSVTIIERFAFYGCSGLTSVTIPNSVTEIGQRAFGFVPNIIYSGTATGSPWDARSVNGYVDGWLVYSDNTKTNILACSTAAKGEITIPNSVTTIGERVFYQCSSLTSVTIPNSVTSIEQEAFSGCTGLISLTIPNSVTSIGIYAFSGVPNIVYNGTATGYSWWGAKCKNGFVDGWFVYSDNTKTTLEACSSAATGEITIPNSVTSIESSAFSGCSSLTSVIIPNNVTKIGGSAFSGCTGLVSVTIPNSVISIGSFAFSSCTGLTSVTIPNSVTRIDWATFNDCSSLSSVMIPNSVTSIGSYAFQSCTGLISMIIPNSVISIENGAFWGCNGLTSVTIGDGVTSIGEQAFNSCTALTFLSLGNSVTSIANSAFRRCISLTSVIIPSSVTNISGDAFEDCSNLTAIYMETPNPPTIAETSFRNISLDAIFYVPFGSLEAYRSADYWKSYTILVRGLTAESITSSTSYSVSFGDEILQPIIASVGIEGGETFDGNTLELIGLEPNKEYNDISVVLTSNTGETEKLNVSFTTTALELTTQPSKPVSSNTAILLAETNMADSETSCGFEWKRHDAPEDMAPNKVFAPIANGTMAGRLKNLKDDVYYKYRAFYQSAAGTMYYGEWQYIFTGDVAVEFDPILYTYAATAVKESEATLKGYALAGSDDFTEQGFEYWADSRLSNGGNAPARMKADLGEHKTVTASGISMKVTLQDLDEGTVYKYRTYAKIGDQVLYGTLMSFTTLGEFEQGLEELREESHSSARKFLRNGQLYILRGDMIFNASGMRVE